MDSWPLPDQVHFLNRYEMANCEPDFLLWQAKIHMEQLCVWHGRR